MRPFLYCKWVKLKKFVRSLVYVFLWRQTCSFPSCKQKRSAECFEILDSTKKNLLPKFKHSILICCLQPDLMFSCNIIVPFFLTFLPSTTLVCISFNAYFNCCKSIKFQICICFKLITYLHATCNNKVNSSTH